MKPLLSRLVPLLALVCGTLLLADCGTSTASSGKPVVVCTIFSYFDAARAIARNTPIVVQLPLKPKTSPHEYDAIPTDKEAAAACKLYIKNGLMLDDRFDKLVDGTGAATLVIADHISKDAVLNTEETSLDTAPATSADHAHEHNAGNPHIWLDPRVQIRAAELIRDAMIKLAPESRETLEKNAAAYIADLEKLDKDFKAAAAGFKTRDFIGFHAAYDYLAHRYGLNQIASVEEIPGEGLNPAQVERIVKLINDHHIRYVAVESAFNARGLDRIEAETHVQTIRLQPLETYDNMEDSYVSLMRENLEALKKALGT